MPPREKEVSEIQEIVDGETDAWNNKNVDKLLTIFHQDMVWPLPPTPKSHDQITWVFGKKGIVIANEKSINLLLYVLN